MFRLNRTWDYREC